MTRTTIGCDDGVKTELERLKGEYETWDAFLLKLSDRYKNTSEADAR